VIGEAAEGAPSGVPENQAPLNISVGSVDEDPRVEAMMAGLRNEEPSFGTDLWRISAGAGVVLASVGAVLLIWGVFAIWAARRAGPAGLLGGGILAVFGFAFLGVGVWMAYRVLRQRGVL